MTSLPQTQVDSGKRRYNRFLLLVAGLGGLLYGVDVGIIAGALPYLEATSGLSGNQLSVIVAAVLLGSVFSTLVAGALADGIGRKKLMVISGLLFVASIPMIALAHGYGALVLGRLLQGISAGLIGVVVPLYLAECLSAAHRGKGTGMFQWLLTLGIVVSAVIGYCFSLRVAEVEKLNDARQLFAFKDTAWRSIFWVSLPPGILFVLGSLIIAESPRWLFLRGKTEAARAALARSRTDEQAAVEIEEMAALAAKKAKDATSSSASGSILRRKYIVPFVLACVILACNQATGVNSIIGYNTTILTQVGLTDAHAHLGYVILTMVNFLVTMAGVALVDKKGRKFLLSMGTAGIIVSLVVAGLLFRNNEKHQADVREAIQGMVAVSNQTAVIGFNAELADKWLGATGSLHPSSLVVIYSYGDFTAASKVIRSDDTGARIELNRSGCVPPNRVAAFFQNPFADLEKSKTAALRIDHALVTPVPMESTGWLTASCIFSFMAFFAMGPGVCVWLALSELMPTRIRSNGMSIALLINQAVSTTIAIVFLPTVGQHGYSTMFFGFAACTVVYFITATFLLPETKGKTLEEIEEYFDGKKSGQTIQTA